MVMKKSELRYSENFFSVQGEGLFMGVPSVFLRTFGCNFRCKLFGLPKNTNVEKYNPEVEEVIKNIDKYEKFEDLPLIKTGCDTYASIYPEFKKFMKTKNAYELSEELVNKTPNKCWTQKDNQDIHLVITGGEPLLGWQKFYIELFQEEKMKDLQNVTFETNATQKLNNEFVDYLNTQKNIHFTFSCSPKLSGSGERWEKSICPEVVYQYSQIPNSSVYLKFVVSKQEDVKEVEKAVEIYQQNNVYCPIYLMPLGGRYEDYILNTRQVATLSLERGWRYSARLHSDLFGNEWGT